MSSESARHRGIVRMGKQGAHHPPAIVRLLVETLDVPGGVVGHNDDDLRAVAYRRINLHGVDPKGTVACDAHHLSARIGERRSHSVRRSTAKASEGSSVHIGAGVEADTREAEEVAAIGDRDVVWIDLVMQGLKNGARIDGAVRSCCVAWPRLGAAVAMPFLQPFRPS